MKISVLGCGRWGSCIAWYLDKIGHDVLSGGLENAPEFIALKNNKRTTTFPTLTLLRFLLTLSIQLKGLRLLLFLSVVSTLENI